MTKTFGVAVVLGIIGAGAAFAQTAPTTPSAKAPVVISTSPDVKVVPPAAGANSFTESEARSRLEANGYLNVTELKMDEKSVWRGMATKGGTLVHVALDYQGTIVAN